MGHESSNELRKPYQRSNSRWPREQLEVRTCLYNGAVTTSRDDHMFSRSEKDLSDRYLSFFEPFARSSDSQFLLGLASRFDSRTLRMNEDLKNCCVFEDWEIEWELFHGCCGMELLRIGDS